jgi:hypothetical protein
MSEPTPDEDLGRKFAQAVTLAVQVVEVGVQMRARRQGQAEAVGRERVAQLRGEREVAFAADRVRFARAFDPSWMRDARAEDLARAWGAAATWADTSEQADAAARRVEYRLREMFPEELAHYDGLRANGASRVDAMRESVHAMRERGPEPDQGPGRAKAGHEQGAREDPRMAEDRRTWSRAEDPAWLRTATSSDISDSWRAAATWADLSTDANSAAETIEARMRGLHPQVMDSYDRLRGQGATRIEALWQVGRDLQAETEATQADASSAAHRADARAHESTPDDVATAGVDEHREGVQAATGDHGVAVDLGQKASAAAAAAFPTRFRTMAQPTTAVKVRPALGPAPQRTQLTGPTR